MQLYLSGLLPDNTRLPLKKKLCKYLERFVTTNRLELFDRIIKNRTRYITLALEDIYQPHNASAVLRTCDCFGIQDIHVIENKNEYQVNPDVALGSNKWITIHKYNQEENNTLSAIKDLRNKGYRIVATTPHNEDVSLDEFDLNKGKVALFFGTELQGLSNTVINNADEYLKIPMYGFTESFNISVSAAIILHSLTQKLRNSTISWTIPEEDMLAIRLKWLKNTIRRSDLIEKNFLKSNNIE